MLQNPSSIIKMYQKSLKENFAQNLTRIMDLPSML